MGRRKFICFMLIGLLIFIPVQAKAFTYQEDVKVTTASQEGNKLLLPIIKYVVSKYKLNPKDVDYNEKLIYAIMAFRYLEEKNSMKYENETKYIALGDSIAFGLSADLNKGYVDLFKDYLISTKQYNQLKLNNLAVPGYKSSHLLDKLKNEDKIRNYVRQADVITISIGGNNLLSSVIKAIASKYNLNSKETNFVAKLTKAVRADSKWQEKLETLQNDTELMKALNEGVKNFKADWPKIIKEINNLNPDAKIYVMTLYNPLKTDTPVLYDTFEKLIQQINVEIRNSIYDYEIADVYTKFHKYDGKEPLTNFDLLNRTIDPHPTNYGHELIFKAHLKN
ncbi:GDSL-type esterase/lipase family protein [Clostridium sp. ZS2-4]|uniref:GDSL-type esterase/lipase family protein n=1 Tax=Clostridium sp. ZS2-4 TaxID=2987703 RepID=UPI00227B0DDE|nr:GDSL-type esterase/lipase family protein [Clostridium sp. ZS2-4]MCY6355622.1 GDSL-type esterase/lipase family protein [Clostridium sp. ZS2-4]